MNILEQYDLRHRQGEIGIEIEMEGEYLPNTDIVNWKVVPDGSLRGNSQYEYVLKSPATRKNVTKVLNKLSTIFCDCGSILLPSGRCGVHIHINCQQFTFMQTMNFACIHTIFEEILLNYCGTMRAGNMVCLRASDAEYSIIKLKEAFSKQNFDKYINNNHMRYSAMNLISLPKYGSIEFRALSTPKNIMDIEEWINILLQLKDASMTFNKPSEMVERMSMEGPMLFAKQILGKYFDVLNIPNLEELLYIGIRHVQNIAYTKVEQKPKRTLKDKDFYKDNWNNGWNDEDEDIDENFYDEDEEYEDEQNNEAKRELKQLRNDMFKQSYHKYVEANGRPPSGIEKIKIVEKIWLDTEEI